MALSHAHCAADLIRQKAQSRGRIWASSQGLHGVPQLRWQWLVVRAGGGYSYLNGSLSLNQDNMPTSCHEIMNALKERDPCRSPENCHRQRLGRAGPGCLRFTAQLLLLVFCLFQMSRGPVSLLTVKIAQAWPSL